MAVEDSSKGRLNGLSSMVRIPELNVSKVDLPQMDISGMIPDIVASEFQNDAFQLPEVSILPDPVEHQLIVLGNGFDLQCGLKSSFSDFFLDRMPLAEEASGMRGDELVAFMQEKHLTVWDLILLSRRGLRNWCDVESAIRDVVCGCNWDDEDYDDFKTRSKVSALGLSRALSYLSVYKGRQDSDETELENDSYESEWEDDDPELDDEDHDRTMRWLLAGSYSETEELIASYLKVIHEGIGNEEEKGILGHLLEELHSLEAAFDVYMQRALADCSDYEERAARLLSRIGCLDFSDSQDRTYEATVLNFNYTTPSMDQMQYDAACMSNVHGKLGEPIIFGIDAAGTSIEDGTM